MELSNRLSKLLLVHLLCVLHTVHKRMRLYCYLLSDLHYTVVTGQAKQSISWIIIIYSRQLNHFGLGHIYMQVGNNIGQLFKNMYPYMVLK